MFTPRDQLPNWISFVPRWPFHSLDHLIFWPSVIYRAITNPNRKTSLQIADIFEWGQRACFDRRIPLIIPPSTCWSYLRGLGLGCLSHHCTGAITQVPDGKGASDLGVNRRDLSSGTQVSSTTYNWLEINEKTKEKTNKHTYWHISHTTKAFLYNIGGLSI